MAQKTDPFAWLGQPTYEPMPQPSLPASVHRRRTVVRWYWIACAVFAAAICIVALGYTFGPLAMALASMIWGES